MFKSYTKHSLHQICTNLFEKHLYSHIVLENKLLAKHQV